MAFSERLSDILRDRGRRGKAVLFVLTLFAMGYGVYFYLTWDREEPGFQANTICRDCGKRETRRMRSIRDIECSSCKSRKLGFVWKCRDCDYEFPFIKPQFSDNQKQADAWRLIEKIYVCPNCGKRNVFAVPASAKK